MVCMHASTHFAGGLFVLIIFVEGREGLFVCLFVLFICAFIFGWVVLYIGNGGG